MSPECTSPGIRSWTERGPELVAENAAAAGHPPPDRPAELKKIDKNHAGKLDIRPGRYVLITVRDNGRGIAAEDLAKAFDPFFTTKQVDKGKGLGLSMVYGFAQQSGGSARIESMAGKGTIVTLYLPAAGKKG